MSRATHSRSSARILVLSLALTVGLLVSLAPSALSSPSTKIDARVSAQLKAHGSANFWILFGKSANLRAAYHMHNWNARGAFVVDQLKATANSSQAGVRAYLRGQHVKFQSFWIQNGIHVTVGSATVVKSLASRSEVAGITPDWHATVSKITPGSTAAVEWNIKNIKANKVWNNLGVRGEGTVVANIDTGVQYNHPALVNQYRGNLGGGSFNHNYNWWDPSHICAGNTPCDNVQHGTHTMGTMVGLAGANKIGVAPKAKWIAAKGCESNSCSSNALLSSGQWVLAPTNLQGGSPDPSKRPDVVNNSWGGGRGSSWYQATVNSWVASGIFPQFSNGNSGPGCSSANDPGDYVNVYAAGAYDINNVIAGFSSRGPGAFGGEIKPNVAAPGVNVRSSVPTNTYASFSGTSMASPHVAGTVALIISKNPALRGNISAIRTLLDNGATDVNSLGCGGTLDDNNNFGEGRLNAFNSVSAA
jgi:subtilisin family serine protease